MNLLETIALHIKLYRSCSPLSTARRVDHLNWKTICASFQQKFNIPLSVEDAKQVWHSLAYGRPVPSEEDSDDELLFQTDDKPFVLERYLEERNHKLFLKEDGCLLSVEYPYLLSCVSFNVSLMCSGLRFDEDQLELSQLHPCVARLLSGLPHCRYQEGGATGACPFFDLGE